MSLHFPETTTLSETLCPRATLFTITESGAGAITLNDHGEPTTSIQATTICRVEGRQITATEASREASEIITLDAINGNPLITVIEQSRRESTAATLLSHFALNCIRCPEANTCLVQRKIGAIATAADLV